MQTNLDEVTLTVAVMPGERLSLSETVVDSIGPGQWVITIRSLEAERSKSPARGHTTFLNSYAPEDEGLYDDCAAR